MKLVKLLIPLLLFFVSIPLAVQGLTIRNPLGYDTFNELFNAVINFIFTIGLPITGIIIILAGFKFVMAQGDPEKVKEARHMIYWALIGLIIIISAKGFVVFIQRIFPSS